MLRTVVSRRIGPYVAPVSTAAAAFSQLALRYSSSTRPPGMVFAQQPGGKAPFADAPAFELTEELKKDLQTMIGQDRVVCFLTGTPEAPRCRFTVALVDMLNQIGVEYSFVNILEDDEVCEGLKIYSSWPTYPQVYIDNELIGGYDIIKTMMLDGELPKLLKSKKLL